MPLLKVSVNGTVASVMQNSIRDFSDLSTMNENLTGEFIEKGCKNRKDAAIAVQVYLELCEVKRYWDIEYLYNSAFERLYFTARKNQNEKPSIFVPIPVSETLSFRNLQKFSTLCEDSENQTIYIVVVNPDSTCVYYQVTNGLAKPPASLQKTLKDHSEKLDKNLKKNKKLLEEAALYGIPITLPKKKNTEIEDPGMSST